MHLERLTAASLSLDLRWEKESQSDVGFCSAAHAPKTTGDSGALIWGHPPDIPLHGYGFLTCVYVPVPWGGCSKRREKRALSATTPLGDTYNVLFINVFRVGWP